MTRKRLYTEMIKRYNRERKQYFLDAKNESARQNLRMLKKISIFLLPFLIIAFLLTPLLVTQWRISLPYYVLSFCLHFFQSGIQLNQR